MNKAEKALTATITKDLIVKLMEDTLPINASKKIGDSYNILFHSIKKAITPITETELAATITKDLIIKQIDRGIFSNQEDEILKIIGDSYNSLFQSIKDTFGKDTFEERPPLEFTSVKRDDKRKI